MAERVEFSFDELMAEHCYEEPVIAGGVRCHGGYIDGDYVSPRSLNRRPAIDAWRRQLIRAGLPIVWVPDRYVPPNYPNAEQARYLLREDVTEPVTRALTLIAIVEGFGAQIRDLPLPDFQQEVEEPVDGTALAHLGKGLIEAHARDEAGHRDQGGHKQMWEAARDLGLAKPKIPGDVLMSLMTGRARGEARRAFPQISQRMENFVTTVVNVLVIETFADDTFRWAGRLLGDPEVSADPKRAAHIVACIAADEVPHVDYLSVALSELRARTLIGTDGERVPGEVVVDTIFRSQLRGMATRRPRESRERARQDIHRAIEDHARASRIAARFEALDSGWTFPHADDEELDVLLKSA